MRHVFPDRRHCVLWQLVPLRAAMARACQSGPYMCSMPDSTAADSGRPKASPLFQNAHGSGAVLLRPTWPAARRPGTHAAGCGRRRPRGQRVCGGAGHNGGERADRQPARAGQRPGGLPGHAARAGLHDRGAHPQPHVLRHGRAPKQGALGAELNGTARHSLSAPPDVK